MVQGGLDPRKTRHGGFVPDGGRGKQRVKPTETHLEDTTASKPVFRRPFGEAAVVVLEYEGERGDEAAVEFEFEVKVGNVEVRERPGGSWSTTDLERWFAKGLDSAMDHAMRQSTSCELGSRAWRGCRKLFFFVFLLFFCFLPYFSFSNAVFSLSLLLCSVFSFSSLPPTGSTGGS